MLLFCIFNFNYLSEECQTDLTIYKFNFAHDSLKFSPADVVYDVSIVPSLVRVLKTFLVPSRGHPPCVAYIASTIRNEDTRDQFLIALSRCLI